MSPHRLSRPAKRLAIGAVLCLAFAVRGLAADVRSEVGEHACTALAARVDALPGDDPLLLRSYDGTAAAPLEPALATAAFTYDNALATIALLACDRRAPALRVGEALRRAARASPRLRNVYRAGKAEAAPLPNGWWDAAGQRWVEDAYQDGSATGNVAWAALALLALHANTGEAKWLDGAETLARWVVANASDARGAGGFNGGVEGFDAEPHTIAWKSTEHNIDLAALFAWLAAVAPDAAEWDRQGRAARRFVEAQWDTAAGRFLVGVEPDGVTPNRTTSALDVQLWPLLLPGAQRAWRAALSHVEREHRVPGGFDFNADRDGLWLEGTAQAALVYRRLGRAREADALLATIAAQFAPNGLVYATREPRITTGLAIGGDSATADFFYYRRPHVGATAWAALAAAGWNPFTPRGR